MLQIIWIAIAGAIGAVCRWGLNRVGDTLLGTGFAWGTLAANVIGCFFLGFLMHFGLSSDKLSPEVRTAVAVGFLGALTTFSTFSYETIRYIEGGVWISAMANIACHITLGLGATLAGLMVSRVLFGTTVS